MQLLYKVLSRKIAFAYDYRRRLIVGGSKNATQLGGIF